MPAFIDEATLDRLAAWNAAGRYRSQAESYAAAMRAGSVPPPTAKAPPRHGATDLLLFRGVWMTVRDAAAASRVTPAV